MSPIMKPLVFCASVLAMANAFDGDGTFYGAGGAGKGGACMMDNRGVGVTAALNAAQYGGGENCGRCIRVTGKGEGGGANPIIGPIYAIIDNECPECKFGDVDFGLGGDGRWRIFWDFVSCDEARSTGSNLPAVRRSLRAVLSEEAAKAEGTYLPPGYMVTAEGIKAIAEVEAANGQH